MDETTALLFEVDFLPTSFREEERKRRAQLWQLVVIACFGSMLLVAEMGHRSHQQSARNDLAAVEGRYAAAETQSQHLANLESQLSPLRARAELLTYVRHRWPTSQILAAIVRSAPDSVTFSALEVSRDVVHKPQERPATGDAGPKDPAADKLPPDSRDLKQFRAESASSQTVVTLSGTMTDPGELHAYLESLARNRLFAKVALNSIASPATDSAAARFSARLVVRPAYGDPGGPAPGVRSATTQPSGPAQPKDETR